MTAAQAHEPSRIRLRRHAEARALTMKPETRRNLKMKSILRFTGSHDPEAIFGDRPAMGSAASIAAPPPAKID